MIFSLPARLRSPRSEVKTAVAPLAHEIPPPADDDALAELQEIYIEKGTPAFMRTVLALFCGGFATFALLYCVQPMMPLLSHEYGINAAQSSLILSVATGMLAFGLLITGPISDRIGRKPVMVAALFAATSKSSVSDADASRVSPTSLLNASPAMSPTASRASSRTRGF